MRLKLKKGFARGRAGEPSSGSPRCWWPVPGAELWARGGTQHEHGTGLGVRAVPGGKRIPKGKRMKFPRVQLTVGWGGPVGRGEDGGGRVGVLSSAQNPRETAAGRTREVLRLVVVLKTRFVLFFLPQLRLKMRVITHFKKRGRCLQPRSVNGASPPPQPPGAPPGHRPRSSPPCLRLASLHQRRDPVPKISLGERGSSQPFTSGVVFFFFVLLFPKQPLKLF